MRFAGISKEIVVLLLEVKRPFFVDSFESEGVLADHNLQCD